MKEEIVRMKIELEELQEKIKKEKDFLKKEKEKNESEKILDDNQRINLACQLMQMDGYAKCLEERISYDILLEYKKQEVSNNKINKEDNYEHITSDKYAKKHGYKNWDDFEANAGYHAEKTLMDMKIWFFNGSSAADIINVLENEIKTDYGNFIYIKDLNKWIYKYK